MVSHEVDELVLSKPIEPCFYRALELCVARGRLLKLRQMDQQLRALDVVLDGGVPKIAELLGQRDLIQCGQ